MTRIREEEEDGAICTVFKLFVTFFNLPFNELSLVGLALDLNNYP